MKKIFILIKIFLATIILCLSKHSHSQIKETKSAIGISIPVIWNNSEATYYRLGSPKYPSGKATSYGLNIDYSHSLYNGIYGKLGIGYFKQTFKIVRPFNYYPNPLLLIYSTRSYSYNNVQLFVGADYAKNITKNISLNGGVTYSYFYSLSQKYTVNKASDVVQNDKNSFPLGQSVNLEFGITENVSQKISLGLGFLIPVYTHWNKDEIFYNLHYSNDEQQIARNKFSAGFIVSCNYNF